MVNRKSFLCSRDRFGYNLQSKSVKLADNVNHQVTVTGKIAKADGGQETAASATNLNVTNLKVLSDSCSQQQQ